MSLQSETDIVGAGSDSKNVSAGRQAALAWLNEAMLTVEMAFSHVNWGTAIDSGIQAAFDDALAARFWEGTMSADEFRPFWQKWYQAHL